MGTIPNDTDDTRHDTRDHYADRLKALRVTDNHIGQPQMSITFDDTCVVDLPDAYADLSQQVGAAIEQLRAWFPRHRIIVAPRFIYDKAQLALSWDLSAMVDGTHGWPASYGKPTLVEALADMRQQVRRWMDVEAVNAELSDAAFEEALWCGEPVNFDWNETAH